MKNKDAMSPSVERLINDALAIESESALEAGALGFMARAMSLGVASKAEEAMGVTLEGFTFV